ncbi:hypothetical protein E2F50_18845 [Rhizobium deserti]|uniref:Uncharacterized protein n=2 Tax=Rhizobium deserti TaxID=2547961 RepID=A0A4R5UAA9_9HYPH|nr:hypothetical protein E2F50_18845 [Rhizobium deserti]
MAGMRERGLVMDGAPEVVALIADWAAGLIEMPECRERYLTIVRQREQMRRARLHPLVGETILQLDDAQAGPVHANGDSEFSIP